MPKQKKFLCSECGDVFAKWLGKCPTCGTFNSIVEFRESKIIENNDKISGGKNLVDINQEISFEKKERLLSSISEVDRVLGQGFFPGSVTLFGGQPGIGKSTLALQIFLNITDAFYFSGEESEEQILSRVHRLESSKNTKNLEKKIFSTNYLEDIIATIEKEKPKFIIIDSIQMIGTKNINFGSVAQIRENAEILIKYAKSLNIAILVIGHVTKNEELAGPKILEHLVDAVLYLEGEKNSEIIILRTLKNRFGSNLEIGVFEMQEKGLLELKNPSKFFLAERAENSCGSTISVIREGGRNFLLEIQALTLKTNFGQPRRTAYGIDLAKLHLLLAVVSKFTPFKCENFDAYLNVVGGFKITDPAADASICAAILSSRAEKEISAETIILGEVGLSGEIRHIPYLKSRITEAQKMGFKKILCPKLLEKINIKGINILEIRNVADLLRNIF